MADRKTGAEVLNFTDAMKSSAQTFDELMKADTPPAIKEAAALLAKTAEAPAPLGTDHKALAALMKDVQHMVDAAALLALMKDMQKTLIDQQQTLADSKLESGHSRDILIKFKNEVAAQLAELAEKQKAEMEEALSKRAVEPAQPLPPITINVTIDRANVKKTVSMRKEADGSIIGDVVETEESEVKEVK
jgi:hypothetical protein